ncbi:MAG: hypothetical protein NTV34_07465, partial [Proteobacteria bacterium]|nr:hypothetical protein [Pseudomonadota bacterium]
MDQIPKFTSKPSITAGTRAPSIAPVNEIETSLETAVTLTVARSESAIIGHVIVTFAKHGQITCSDLLKCATMFELLSRAESEGVKIAEPALLATIDDQGIARTVYLTPRPDPQFRDYAQWVGTVTEVLSSLKAQQVGLYLCKDSLEKGALS